MKKVKLLASAGPSLSEVMKTELERTFGTDIRDLRRNHRHDIKILFKIMHRNAYIGGHFSINEEGKVKTKLEYILKTNAIKKLLSIINKKKLSFVDVEELEEIILGPFIEVFKPDIYFMPASRAGIIHSYRTIAASIISSAPLTAVRGVNIPRIPGVLADFLSLLINIEPEKRTRRESSLIGIPYFRRKIGNREKTLHKELANKLEEEIFGGEIRLIRKTGLYPPEPTYIIDSVEIGIANVSSMIAELTPLDLFLKYGVLSRGDTLVIEEPEAHLHPDKQVKLIELLSLLVNRAGINLVITTHSDVVLSKLSNLVKLSYIVSEEKDRRYKDIAIKRDKIAVYHFKKEKDGVTVEKVKVSREGIPDNVFYSIVKDLYEESMNLYYRLQKEYSEKK